jgi:LuxR family maltose regulon positive regulatory protein
VAAALDAIEPMSSGLGAARSEGTPSAALDALLRCIESRERPFVLALDDVHRLHAPESIGVLTAIVDHLPRGSQLAVASRSEPGMPVGRLTANRDVVELRYGDLRMTPSEAARLLEGAGVEVSPTEADTILQRTEGWAAGLYLAALSLRESSDAALCASAFRGRDRRVADYVRDEILSVLPQDRAAFMTRCSLLQQPTGAMCDSVLERSGSGRLLESLARANLMLFAADEPGRYRMHPLLAEVLQEELARREPETVPELHRRAATWHAAGGENDQAVEHAVAADDARLTGDLIWANLQRYVGYGQNAKVQRWLEKFTGEQIAAHPPLALVAAVSHLAQGDGTGAAHWIAAGARERAASAPSDGPALEAAAAIVRAGVAADSIATMRADADRACRQLAERSPWRATALLLIGTAEHLGGDRSGGRAHLEKGARTGAAASPHVQALCLAQLAVISIEESDWAAARAHAMRARAQVQRHHLTRYPTSALTFAVSAAVHAQAGQVDEAKVDMRQASALASALIDFAPWYEAELRIVLAGAAARLSDPSSARSQLTEASRLIEQTPDATLLVSWLERSWARAEATPATSPDGGWSLTTAELRVLQFLPTHISFPAIAVELNVSANTVKTHSRAVYRKLGASSRTQAVLRAHELGLIDSPRPVLAAAA